MAATRLITSVRDRAAEKRPTTYVFVARERLRRRNLLIPNNPRLASAWQSEVSSPLPATNRSGGETSTLGAQDFIPRERRHLCDGS